MACAFLYTYLCMHSCYHYRDSSKHKRILLSCSLAALVVFAMIGLGWTSNRGGSSSSGQVGNEGAINSLEISPLEKLAAIFPGAGDKISSRHNQELNLPSEERGENWIVMTTSSSTPSPIVQVR